MPWAMSVFRVGAAVVTFLWRRSATSPERCGPGPTPAHVLPDGRLILLYQNSLTFENRQLALIPCKPSIVAGRHAAARAPEVVGRPTASLLLSWGIRFVALGWLALRFCAAVVVGLAIVAAAIVAWAAAALVIAVVGEVPQKRSL
jgi:hypothetical protein